MTLLRLAEHAHGHLGWLAAALLVHPAVVLSRPKRRAHLAVGLATGLVTIAAALGAWIYVPFRDDVRPRLYAEAPAIGLLMERKEHLAFGAVVLAWAGAAAYVAGHRTIAFRSFACASALAIAVAALGTIVASHATF